MVYKNLTLKELCDKIFQNRNKKLLIFNLTTEKDRDKNIEAQNTSLFKFDFDTENEDFDASCVKVGLNSEEGTLPLWLIESDEWVLKVESVAKTIFNCPICGKEHTITSDIKCSEPYTPLSNCGAYYFWVDDTIECSCGVTLEIDTEENARFGHINIICSKKEN